MEPTFKEITPLSLHFSLAPSLSLLPQRSLHVPTLCFPSPCVSSSGPSKCSLPVCFLPKVVEHNGKSTLLDFESQLYHSLMEDLNSHFPKSQRPHLGNEGNRLDHSSTCCSNLLCMAKSLMCLHRTFFVFPWIQSLSIS